jgi:transcriptional regulator with XRE-family HTH domain
MKRSRLAALLRQARLDADLTQAQLADAIGQSQSYVSKYESGEQRLDLVELDAICKAVDVPLLALVEQFVEAR